MDLIWEQLTTDLPSLSDLLLVMFRLFLAVLVGSLPGFQRELMGEAAGLRTHMLVSLGAAVFVLSAMGTSATPSDTARIIQGVATGIGFIGGGAILKSSQEHSIHGLTTAASIWLTAALGTSVGMGRVWMPVLGSFLTVAILTASPKGRIHEGEPRKQ
jgi:putative Mg2+ transporter-C (MgtC) family protein